MGELLPLIPNVLHQQLLSSPYYAQRSHSLVIKADESRKASENAQKCFEKLRNAIETAGKFAVKGETSSEQVEKVKKL